MNIVKVKIDMNLLFIIYLAFQLFSCGIEVGNPHDDDSDGTTTKNTSQLTVEIADSPIDNIANIFLNISSISLLTKEEELYPLDLASTAQDPVDILSLQNGLTEILVNEQEVVHGDYQGFVIELNEEKIGWMISSQGDEVPLRLPLTGQNYLVIEDPFTIDDDEDIVLHIDILQSLDQEDQSYILNPVFHPVSRRKVSALKGRLQSFEAGVMCAYFEKAAETNTSLHSLNEGLDRSGILKSEGRFFAPPPPPPRDRIHSPRIPKEGRRPDRPDSQAGKYGKCFVSSPVNRNGVFGFHFLEPGEYTLRFFARSGFVFDVDGSYSVTSGLENDIGSVELVRIQ